MKHHGIDALHVGDAGLATANDAEIVVQARTEDRVIATFDADFHALLALSAAGKPSVIRIRVEGLRAEALTALLLRVIEQCEADLTAGAMVSAEATRLRVHRLPVIKPTTGA